MTEISATHQHASAVPAEILELIATGRASSRADLVVELDVSASTVSTAVHKLIADGLLTERGQLASTGGRPRRVLSLGTENGYTIAADLGGGHARVGVVRQGGGLEDVATVPFTAAQGPEAGLAQLADALDDLIGAHTDSRLMGIGLAVPGPVDLARTALIRPSRMPGWSGFPTPQWLEERFGVPTAIDNDANLMALGEYTTRAGKHDYSITVKAGTAIGAGIITNGRIHRGADGAAGDITHVRIEAAGDNPCSCGNTGCLETVASGAALVRILREGGHDVTSTADVIELAAAGQSDANRAARDAGRHLGQVLSVSVNFFNPTAIYIGGALSTLEPFVAAVRGQLYEACHPLVTERLTIERVSLGADAGLVGAGVLAFRNAMSRALQGYSPATIKEWEAL